MDALNGILERLDTLIVVQSQATAQAVAGAQSNAQVVVNVNEDRPRVVSNVVNLRNFTTDRPSKKLKAVLEWLSRDGNEQYWDTPSRELVGFVVEQTALKKVSHMTINKAQRMMRELGKGAV